MEGIEMDEPAITNDEANDDFGNSILSGFANSTTESHQHLCAVISAMSQNLKDHNLPSSPVAYFAATCSSLDRIVSESNPPNHLVDVLLTILSLVISRVPDPVLKKKREFLFYLVDRVLDSPSASETAVVHGMKCLSHLSINRDSVSKCVHPSNEEHHVIGDISSIEDKKDPHNDLFNKKMWDFSKCTQKASKIDDSKSSMQIDDASNDVSPSVLRAQHLDFAVSLLFGLGAKYIASLFQELIPAMQDDEGVMQKKASIALRDNMERWKKIVLFLAETILALKEANKKIRNRANVILVEVAHELGDEERVGNRESLYQFFITVAFGLFGETPCMISATVTGLARLAYEFPDLVLPAFKLLPSTFVLLQSENREIIKASLGFLKVLVAKSQAEGLQMHLRTMVEGLLKWQDNTKNPFEAKVKLLLGMLVTKCGLEAVKAVMPEEHMKLLSNICKIKRRKQRNRGAKSEETRSRLSKATTSRSNMRLEMNLPEHLSDKSDDEPLDLLDRQKTVSALRSSEHLKRKSRLDDDEVELDSEGRLIIREEGERRKEKPAVPGFDTRSEPDSHLSARSGTKAQKRIKTSGSGWAYTGKEYASKKAGGDVKRKNKLQPYAYWPLDRKMISRRPQQRAAAKKGMASVVKMTRKLEGKSSSGVLSLKSLKLKRGQHGKEKKSSANVDW